MKLWTVYASILQKAQTLLEKTLTIRLVLFHISWRTQSLVAKGKWVETKRSTASFFMGGTKKGRSMHGLDGNWAYVPQSRRK